MNKMKVIVFLIIVLLLIGIEAMADNPVESIESNPQYFVVSMPQHGRFHEDQIRELIYRVGTRGTTERRLAFFVWIDHFNKPLSFSINEVEKGLRNNRL